MLDPLGEMTAVKNVEMFAESIPGAAIQMVAIATKGGPVAFAAWASLIISALTTGFTASTVSYDFDTDPDRRERMPEFYGYVPNKAAYRTVVFISMCLFTAGEQERGTRTVGAKHQQKLHTVFLHN